MTPTERRPVSVPDEFRSVAISCLKRRPVVEDCVGPLENAFAIGGQPVETLTTLHNRNAQLLLELADAPRQRRLADVARLSRPGEVLLPGQGDEILELSDIHAQPSVTGPQFNLSFK